MLKICQATCETLHLLPQTTIPIGQYFHHAHFTDEETWASPCDCPVSYTPKWWSQGSHSTNLRAKALNPKVSKLDYFKGEGAQIDVTWWLIPCAMLSAVEPDFTTQQEMWPSRAQSGRGDPTRLLRIRVYWRSLWKGQRRALYPSWDPFSSLPLPGNIILTTPQSSQSSPKSSSNKLLPRNCVCRVKTWTHSSVAKQKRAQNRKWVIV